MWAAHHGPIPAGLVVRHRCDRPWCVHVECLGIGTQSDNLRDAARRDRITNTKLVGRADKRGAARAARAVREAVLDAVRQGVHRPGELAEVVTTAEVAGDPYADQITLFWVNRTALEYITKSWQISLANPRRLPCCVSWSGCSRGHLAQPAVDYA
jgi:hypothetical protein